MIDLRPVGHILGWLVLLLGLLMIPCILVDLVDGNPNAREFALTAVITIVAGAAIARRLRRRRPRRTSTCARASC